MCYQLPQCFWTHYSKVLNMSTSLGSETTAIWSEKSNKKKICIFNQQAEQHQVFGSDQKALFSP